MGGWKLVSLPRRPLHFPMRWRSEVEEAMVGWEEFCRNPSSGFCDPYADSSNTTPDTGTRKCSIRRRLAATPDGDEDLILAADRDRDRGNLHPIAQWELTQLGK
ncbi:hypothetical protein SAY86_029161 [Trapa natans]|uniref:Uncharacterized protein n=1 Tax=Trapa natans TaxID=22666 RepID=A0AAN7RCT9_TRANT|nr:hypothetical protein SAY86_029161 [Trapa natans]